MSATHFAHVRRLTIHDAVTGATTKALFFSIEKHFLQGVEIHVCITGVILFSFFFCASLLRVFSITGR